PTTRTRHVGNDPNVERYDPDLWTDEFAFLNPARPGRHSKRPLLRLSHERRGLLQDANPSAGPGRFQIGLARTNRLEAIPGVPTFGPARHRCRSALRARSLRDQGQGALRREDDATQTPGGQS